MSAVISDCGKYRYMLSRGDMTNPLVFIMLNPSTADADKDDPTIRRCRRFAKDLGYTGLVVVNLYAYRATNPKELKVADDPVGPENDKFIRALCLLGDVCFAWGNNADRDRASQVVRMLNGLGCLNYCLGKSKTGAPKHPLYLPANSQLITY